MLFDPALGLDFSHAFVDHFVVITGGHFILGAFRSGDKTHHQPDRDNGAHTLGDLFGHMRFFTFKDAQVAFRRSTIDGLFHLFLYFFLIHGAGCQCQNKTNYQDADENFFHFFLHVYGLYQIDGNVLKTGQGLTIRCLTGFSLLLPKGIMRKFDFRLIHGSHRIPIIAYRKGFASRGDLEIPVEPAIVGFKFDKITVIEK
jgi:hypothetical protein